LVRARYPINSAKGSLDTTLRLKLATNESPLHQCLSSCVLSSHSTSPSCQCLCHQSRIVRFGIHKMNCRRSLVLYVLLVSISLTCSFKYKGFAVPSRFIREHVPGSIFEVAYISSEAVCHCFSPMLRCAY
jgi:hypothetical protein